MFFRLFQSIDSSFLSYENYEGGKSIILIVFLDWNIRNRSEFLKQFFHLVLCYVVRQPLNIDGSLIYQSVNYLLFWKL
jgi:hypothetical protein